jgi:hypothetical protein
MPEVLKLLGVEVGEKFNLVGSSSNPFHFNKDYDLYDDEGNYASLFNVSCILRGTIEIEKLPWKPKDGEAYCIVTSDDGVIHTVWWGYSDDYYRYNAGNCFRTTEEITPEIKQRILNEMKGKYEND